MPFTPIKALRRELIRKLGPLTLALVTAFGLGAGLDSIANRFRGSSQKSAQDPPPFSRADSSHRQIDTRTRQQIRKVDFANITYSAEPIYEGSKTFELKDGHYEGPPILVPCELPRSDCYQPVSLVAVAYGDVTGDGVEEAMVVLTESIRGTAIPYFVYVFAIEKGRPKLLWAFATGDRAQGGLRQVYAENGELVIELYGEGARVNGNIWVASPNGACCAVSFTRTRYAWKNDNFEQDEESEVFPVAERGGDLEMKIQKPD
jgi:hypothetical protein